MTEEAWATLLELISWIEADPPVAGGVIAFDSGDVFVERGRICWAAARGRADRLTDLLVKKALPGTDLNGVFRKCRDTGDPLGETLVASGIVAEGDLEDALRRHTAESLVEIVQTINPAEWITRPGGYSPRFTFKPLHTYLDVVDVVVGDNRQRAIEGLAPLATPARRGAAFMQCGELAIPIATSGDVELTELWTLGEWSASLRDAAHELAVDPGFALGTTDDQSTTIVWWQDGLTYALIGEDRAAVSKMTSYHLQRSSS